MASIKDILSIEVANSDSIHLYREGIFFKAYEYSAYRFVHAIKNYRLKRKHYKIVNSDVVSTGFPMSAFKSLPLPEGTIVTDKGNDKHIILQTPLDESNYTHWKSAVPLCYNNDKKEKATQIQLDNRHVERNTRDAYRVRAERIVLDKLSRFNLEGATPIECMLFVAELRSELTKVEENPIDNRDFDSND